MKSTISALGLAVLFSLAQIPLHGETNETDPLYQQGKTKFEQICVACHKYEQTDTMIAPPVFAIQMRYQNAYGTDEAAFRKAIVEWAKSPDENKSHMPGAITKFKLMPPLPLPDVDLDAIAVYLYRADLTGVCDMPQGATTP